MSTHRAGMTGRQVSLHSREAGDSFVAGSVAERVALVATISREIWALSRRPLPEYKRNEIPITTRRLNERAGE